jgi:hypothetical protein
MHKTHKTLPLLLVVCALAVSACAVESEPTAEDDGAIGSVAQALDQSKTLPEGLVCGLRHGYNSFQTDVHTFGCDAAGAFETAPGYDFVATGDWGMPSAGGFFHQELFTNTSATNALNRDSSMLRIPRGTVMGLGHSLNRKYARTMFGWMGESSSCPGGFTKRYAFDAGAGGAFWFWCEYNDPRALCPPGACRTNVPKGTVCGLGYMGQVNAICEGQNTSNGCPAGWTVRGPRDELAPWGSGLRWCERNP